MSADSKSPLVALRQRREEAIQLLTDCYAQDTIELDEYEQRLDRAHQATNMAALEAVVQDLGPLAPAPREALTVAPRATPAVAPPARKRMVSILGGIERKGTWVVPARLDVYSVLGGAELDLREAVLAPGVTEINIRCLLGGAELILSPDIAVETEGIAILGGFEEVHRAPASPDPDRPLVRVSGLTVLGGVSIETRLPGETRRQAKRRERRERKQR